MTPRNLGRRRWFDHWPIRLSIFLGVVLLVASIATLFYSIRTLQKPTSPHFTMEKCFSCHEAGNSKMTSDDCFHCHDRLTRELLPNAVADRMKITERPCFHPIKLVDDSGIRSITQLCLSCHDSPKAYVSLLNIKTGKYVEIDMGATHPVGLTPTETIYPHTLILEKDTGAINCVTCHDPHGNDKRLHLLRYYHPGNGRPADFRPLCNDCHLDEWLPLRLGARETITR